MNRLIHSLVLRSMMGALLSLLSFSTWAGGPLVGTITYGPVAASTPVPTMSGVMLVMLALLLATIAYRVLRQKENNAGRMMVLSLLAVGTLASGIGGIKLIDDAYATGVPTTDLTDPNGSQVSFEKGLRAYRNQTGDITEIKSVIPFPDCFLEDDPSPLDECTEGTQLANNAECFVEVYCDL